jgi:hypothetical protein
MPCAPWLALRVVRSDSWCRATAAGLIFPGSYRCLDQLGQDPDAEAELVVRAAPSRGVERGLVLAQAVVEHGGRELGAGHRQPLASGSRILHPGFELAGCPAAPGRQQQREVRHPHVPGRRRDRVRFVEQVRGCGELAGEDVMCGDVVEGEREHGKGPGFPGLLDVPGGQCAARLVVPQVHGGVAAKP